MDVHSSPFPVTKILRDTQLSEKLLGTQLLHYDDDFKATDEVTLYNNFQKSSDYCRQKVLLQMVSQHCYTVEKHRNGRGCPKRSKLNPPPQAERMSTSGKARLSGSSQETRLQANAVKGRDVKPPDFRVYSASTGCGVWEDCQQPKGSLYDWPDRQASSISGSCMQV